ncbi:MAG: MC/SLC25 family protein [Rhizobiales bacterium]|nr:MC/SLC25 family protein [Hyphomicrobiales bacterium]
MPLSSAVSERALVSLAAGSIAGLVSSTLTFPLDVIRRNAQMPGFEQQTYGQVRSRIPRFQVAWNTLQC